MINQNLTTPLLQQNLKDRITKEVCHESDKVEALIKAADTISFYYEKIYRILEGRVQGLFKLFDFGSNITIANDFVNVAQFCETQVR